MIPTAEFVVDIDSTRIDAEQLQLELASRVIRVDDYPQISRIAGVDAGYSDKESAALAAACVIDANSLSILETSTAIVEVHFPYIPGFLSFREVPALTAAIQKLKSIPDLIVCDGNGIAHPRRFGLASHLGVLLDLPTIGCAKSLHIGIHEEVGPNRGDRAPIVDHGETIGAALRTQDGINPVFVSIGHRISLETACDWVLRLADQFRLPNTTRCANRAVREAQNQRQKSSVR